MLHRLATGRIDGPASWWQRSETVPISAATFDGGASWRIVYTGSAGQFEYLGFTTLIQRVALAAAFTGSLEVC